MSETSNLPLRDLVVIDAATMLAGPWAATFLADFGATVIKVEHPEKGDTVRNYGKKKDGKGVFWKTIGRNKRCVTLNLSTVEGQALFKKLVAKADVLIENYRPGTMEKWHIGWEDLHAVNPSLVMLRVTAFGQSGPYSKRAGFGTVAEAMSGFTSINGPKGGDPVLPGMPLADGVCGYAGALSIMIALHERALNGEKKGQYIDVNLYEPLMRLLETHIVAYDQLGFVPGPMGNGSLTMAPRNAYKTSDGVWMALSGAAQPIAARVFQIIGQPDLINDERFCDNAARMANVEALDALISDWIGAHTMEEVQSAFEECGAAIGPMYTMRHLFEDPQYLHRGSFVTVEDDDFGPMRMPNVLCKFSRTPGKVITSGPAKSTHNVDIFCGLLGLSAQELEELKARGVV